MFRSGCVFLGCYLTTISSINSQGLTSRTGMPFGYFIHIICPFTFIYLARTVVEFKWIIFKNYIRVFFVSTSVIIIFSE
jgi:hypothetical protein